MNINVTDTQESRHANGTAAGGHLRRLALRGSALMTILFLGAGAARAAPEAAPTVDNPVALVDALNGVFGKQTYGRAIHAKGILLQGTFTPDSGAAKITKAAQFQKAKIPITVRFSDFAGIPAVSDTDPLATPRGMAIRFRLQDGTDTDIVSHSFNGFPTRTAEEFRQMMIALGTSGPNAVKPTPAETFMGAHPMAKAFFDHLPPPPESFGTLPYFGVNSFQFTNSHNVSVYGRYQIIPAAGTHWLANDQIESADANYLNTEIKRRAASGPIEFVLQLQVAKPGDRIDDPSIAWPDSRRIVRLGVIHLDQVSADSEVVERQLMFSPAAVTDGIRPADPMIAARAAAYGVSFARRHAAP